MGFLDQIKMSYLFMFSIYIQKYRNYLIKPISDLEKSRVKINVLEESNLCLLDFIVTLNGSITDWKPCQWESEAWQDQRQKGYFCYCNRIQLEPQEIFFLKTFF